MLWREMRVGLVIYNTLETISGGYLYDRKLVEYLRRAGDAVEIVSLPQRYYAAHLFDNFSADLFQRLCQARVDVWLQDELNHPSLFYLNRRLRSRGCAPILSIVHHLRSAETHPAWQKIFYRWVEQQYLMSVDGFIFNSRTTRQAVSAMLGRTPANSVLAYPAGDRFDAPIDAARICARAREPGALRLVFVGNLIPRKGLHSLLKALARLPMDTWQLEVIGNPAIDRRYTTKICAQIRAQCLSNVRLRGVLDDAALAHTLAQSHVLVVPSTYEGYGIVYLEAMNFGLPAIATTAGAAYEIITDGVNGFLVAPNDAVTLAARLEQLARDREQLVRLSLAARERFLAHPPWETSLRQIRQHLLGLRQ